MIVRAVSLREPEHRGGSHRRVAPRKTAPAACAPVRTPAAFMAPFLPDPAVRAFVLEGHPHAEPLGVSQLRGLQAVQGAEQSGRMFRIIRYNRLFSYGKSPRRAEVSLFPAGGFASVAQLPLTSRSASV